jgi:hypothetical protein
MRTNSTITYLFFVLKIYNSNRDVIKRFQISTIKLQECLKTGEIHNGYIWKKVE